MEYEGIDLYGVMKAPEPKRARFPWFLWSGLVTAGFVAVVTGYDTYTRFTRPTVSVVDSTTVSSVLRPYNDSSMLLDISDGFYESKLTSALIAWEKALGHPIKRPTLYFGRWWDCGLGTDIAACANPANYSIILVDPLGDERTVLMHEIGHLLGVPHIEGDALMNAVHHDKVAEPTPFAVAIAKVAWKGK